MRFIRIAAVSLLLGVSFAPASLRAADSSDVSSAVAADVAALRQTLDFMQIYLFNYTDDTKFNWDFYLIPTLNFIKSISESKPLATKDSAAIQKLTDTLALLNRLSQSGAFSVSDQQAISKLTSIYEFLTGLRDEPLATQDAAVIQKLTDVFNQLKDSNDYYFSWSSSIDDLVNGLADLNRAVDALSVGITPSDYSSILSALYDLPGLLSDGVYSTVPEIDWTAIPWSEMLSGIVDQNLSFPVTVENRSPISVHVEDLGPVHAVVDTLNLDENFWRSVSIHTGASPLGVKVTSPVDIVVPEAFYTRLNNLFDPKFTLLSSILQNIYGDTGGILDNTFGIYMNSGSIDNWLKLIYEHLYYRDSSFDWQPLFSHYDPLFDKQWRVFNFLYDTSYTFDTSTYTMLLDKDATPENLAPTPIASAGGFFDTVISSLKALSTQSRDQQVIALNILWKLSAADDDAEEIKNETENRILSLSAASQELSNSDFSESIVFTTPSIFDQNPVSNLSSVFNPSVPSEVVLDCGTFSYGHLPSKHFVFTIHTGNYTGFFSTCRACCTFMWWFLCFVLALFVFRLLYKGCASCSFYFLKFSGNL